MTKSSFPSHMSQHSDTITSIKEDPTLTLATTAGKQVELRASQLEKWFAKVELELRQKKEKEAPSSYWSTQFLSRYGLKTAQDVINFLKSPAGGSVKAAIEGKLAELASIKEELAQNERDKQTRRHRLLAFLLLGLLYSKKAKAKHLRELIEEEARKVLHLNKPVQKTPTEESTSEILLVEFSRTLQAYEHSMQEMQRLLDEKLVASQALEDEMKLLQEQESQLQQKYSIFDNSLEQLDNQLAVANSESLSHEEKLQYFQNELNQLTEKLDKQAATISALIEGNQDEEATKLLQEHNGLHLQAAGLKDQLAALKQTKSFYNSEGEKLSSFNQADFLLSHEQKIIKDNGKYYLLSAHQDFESMDIHDKTKAQARFEQAKPEIMPLKKLVKHNQNIENTIHQDKKNTLNTRSETMQTQLLLLSQQLNQMHAAKEETYALMQQQHNKTPVPKPVPEQQPDVNRFNTAQSYKHVLQLMRTNPTPEAIERFKNGLFKANNQIDPKLAQIVTQIKPGKPIPEDLMRNLLKLFGEDQAKPRFAAPTPFNKIPR